MRADEKELDFILNLELIGILDGQDIEYEEKRKKKQKSSEKLQISWHMLKEWSCYELI